MLFAVKKLVFVGPLSADMRFCEDSKRGLGIDNVAWAL
jgi:hypothetical protein